MIVYSKSIQRDGQHLGEEGAVSAAPSPFDTAASIQQSHEKFIASTPEPRLILLVDDSSLILDVTQSLLRQAGHDVVLARNGSEAVQMAAQRLYDLILMDVRMPVMDGITATKRIRELPGPNGLVPIVAHTTNSLPDQITQCANAGMNAHVCKPVTFARLTSVIQRTSRSCKSLISAS